MGGEDCAIRFCHADLLCQFGGAQPAVVGFIQAFAIQVCQIAAQAGFLLRVACRAIQPAALAIIAVDAFTIDDVFHLIGNAVEQIEGLAPLCCRQACKQAVFAQQVAHQPAAIAP